MWSELTGFLKGLWPLGLIVLPCAAINCLLLCVFSEAIEASVSLGVFYLHWDKGGPEGLFALNSGLLCWLSIFLIERRTGTVGPLVMLSAMLCCVAAVVVGFGAALVLLGGLSDASWQMLAYSLVTGAVVSLFRGYTAMIF